jgi:indole-3-glycerol phosphate synthase
MAQLNQLARDLGMDVLIEVHDSFEAEAALALNPDLLGINNRNLRTFEVSLKTTFDLLEMLPAGVIAVTESGIRTRVDVEEMQNAGVNSFLVGEAFMRVKEPGKKLKELFF